jgi:hypothetical protein
MPIPSNAMSLIDNIAELEVLMDRFREKNKSGLAAGSKTPIEGFSEYKKNLLKHQQLKSNLLSGLQPQEIDFLEKEIIKRKENPDFIHDVLNRTKGQEREIAKKNKIQHLKDQISYFSERVKEIRAQKKIYPADDELQTIKIKLLDMHIIYIKQLTTLQERINQIKNAAGKKEWNNQDKENIKNHLRAILKFQQLMREGFKENPIIANGLDQNIKQIQACLALPDPSAWNIEKIAKEAEKDKNILEFDIAFLRGFQPLAVMNEHLAQLQKIHPTNIDAVSSSAGIFSSLSNGSIDAPMKSYQRADVEDLPLFATDQQPSQLRCDTSLIKPS